ncbi:cytochrome c-type biogenesis protein [Asticcacaulis benevestitus]|uniref:cytochrome c-type biogenesis protein n=1 Tax=Asticcacaulis benevestitus TaxID=347481 RepID=UPI0012DBE797|nr:cytochrome c-type biogenesis protein [Asticcacaulis benevestitus]
MKREQAPTLYSSACRGVLWLLLLFIPLHAFAATEKDEARARLLFTEVRCVQCQSESIADSDAQIAGDMRREIRADIAAGRTDAEIRKELFDHYGDYVLFRPRLTLSNLILWTLPLLIVGVGGVFMFTRRKNLVESTQYALSDDEENKLRIIMKKRD